jgi:hypothetical protein
LFHALAALEQPRCQENGRVEDSANGWIAYEIMINRGHFKLTGTVTVLRN